MDAMGANYESFGDREKSLHDFADEITLEGFDNLKDDYLKLCFYESLRMEPPVSFNSSVQVTEDTTIAGFMIKKGDPIFQNAFQLHHNIDQWGPTHDKYIPERFEHGSTMSPPNRSIMSFIPFSGGKRVCIGKTFAEITFKVVMPLIFKAFSQDGKFGEFVNKADYHTKRHVNAL